jgi:hypothetical protein
MKKLYIGIDPDTEKNGVAYWYTETKKLELENLTFFELFDALKNLKIRNQITVIIDAGWLNKTNFHVLGTNKRVNGKIGERVGANHETGKKIAEMCVYLGIEFRLNKPNYKKVDKETFAKLTRYTGRTNQDTRDAGMLVYLLT